MIERALTCKGCKLNGSCPPELIPEVLIDGQITELTDRGNFSALGFCRHICCPTGLEEAATAQETGEFSDYYVQGLGVAKGVVFETLDKRTKKGKYRIALKDGRICSRPKDSKIYYLTGQQTYLSV